MKTFQTTTNIAPIISVGTYWGHFDYESLWSDDEREEREEGRYVCNDYSHRKLGEVLAAEATTVFAREKPFEDVGVLAIRAVSFGSPREYNFGDDWLDLEFDVADDFLDRAEKKVFDPRYGKRFGKYIEDHWCSRDGFISSMPASSLDDMHEVFRQLREDDCGIDDMRCFGSVIALLYEAARQDGELIDDEDDAFYASMTGQLLERFTGNHSLSEFCTVLDKDEAGKLYPSAGPMLARAGAGRRELADKLAKYCETDVPDSAKEKARKEVDERAKWIDDFADRVRNAIELWHPDSDRVKAELSELEGTWNGMFGEDGDVCAKDLPGQMELPGMEGA